jgi:acyl-CoA thioester hydrolase
MSAFRTSRRVEFADTDMAGIVHFSNYYRYMESVEVEFLRTLGLSVTMRTDAGEKFGFPRVASSCDFLVPVSFMDVLDISIGVERLGTKSVTYRYEFEKAGVLIARGSITAVCCRFRPEKQIEAIPIPESIRAKLAPFVVSTHP